MINANSFIEAARDCGFEYYSGVPCSFLTPFINYVINDESLNYISAANEGDAVATAAGLALAGKPAIAMMQNSGLGNAVSPLTSLNYIFEIPILIITTHRGAPDLQDEPQHELMGRITPELFDTMQIPWEFFPDTEDAVQPSLQRALKHMQKERKPYALIMKKGTVAPHELTANSIPGRSGRKQIREDINKEDQVVLSRTEVLKEVIKLAKTDNSVVIASTGFTGRELFALSDRSNHLYMVGSMGCASSLGLGVSLARPDLRVFVIDGDGAALMRMGNFATLGTYARSNLIHVLLDNEAHDSTGAQATVAGNVNFADIAGACGYGLSMSGNTMETLDKLCRNDEIQGPRFAQIKIKTGTIENLPRPDVTPAKVLQRLMQQINSEFF